MLNSARQPGATTSIHDLIPGGSHTYAKGDDQYPVCVPRLIERGLGCHVWDTEGVEYIEYGNGNRAVGLGHAFAPVVAATVRQLALGANFARPAAIEQACAETFLDLIDTAEMVKFCKDGSDATSGAVRLARAYTGRDLIACCGDHPFFSVDDWFIGTTAMNAGIPEATRALTVTFRYGDIEDAKRLFAAHPGQIAGLILEPARLDDPPVGYLAALKDLCHHNGALFILDEMITGFRWHARGAQHLYGVTPDLSTFGKALANGFSVSALAGKREFMRLGGLDHTDKPRVFLLSTTHGGETHELAAAIATMETYVREPVVEHMHAVGERLRTGFQQAIDRHGVGAHVRIMGRASNMVYATTDPDRRPSQGYRSLFLQETLRRGILMPSLVVSYSHQNEDIDRTVDAVDAALAVYVRALSDGYEAHLEGRPSQVVYRPYNTSETAIRS